MSLSLLTRGVNRTRDRDRPFVGSAGTSAEIALDPEVRRSYSPIRLIELSAGPVTRPTPGPVAPRSQITSNQRGKDAELLVDPGSTKRQPRLRIASFNPFTPSLPLPRPPSPIPHAHTKDHCDSCLQVFNSNRRSIPNSGSSHF